MRVSAYTKIEATSEVIEPSMLCPLYTALAHSSVLRLPSLVQAKGIGMAMLPCMMPQERMKRALVFVSCYAAPMPSYSQTVV
jgi:hypothetical protein